MASDDDTPHRLVGRAGLVFAYVCFAVAITTIGGAIYLLPIPWKARLFLSLATAVLTSLFVFMAVLTHMALRKRPTGSSARNRETG